MKTLIPLYDERELSNYLDDINRIIEVCKNQGYLISFEHAKLVWEDHSDDWSVDWLDLPKSDETLFNVIRDYTTEGYDEIS